MTSEEIQQCLEEAFGGLEPPCFEELTASYDIDLQCEDALKTGTTKTKRWQELRPLRNYLADSIGIGILRPKAWQYYLPAYLYAMTDPEVIWCYLSSVLNTLWYQTEFGDLLFNDSFYRDRWEEFTSILTDLQKQCIAHWLVEMLKSADDASAELNEVTIEAGRIEHMLQNYWSAWL